MMASSEVMTRYLLGQLNDQENQRLEESFFGDDEVFDALMVAEGELIEAYLQGELPEDQRVQFEKQLQASEKRRSRVETARLLAAEARRVHLRAAGSNGGDPSPSGSSYDSGAGMAGGDFPVGKPGRRTLYRALPAAAAIALAVLTGSLWWNHQTLQRDLTTVRSENRDQSLRLTQLDDELANSPKVLSQPLAIPPRVRGGNRFQEVLLEPAHVLVQLPIPLPREAPLFDRYRVTLVDLSGDQRWERSGLQPTAEDGQPQLLLQFPAAELPEGQYDLRIHGEDGSRDEGVSVAEIFLRVRRESPQP